MVCIPALYSGLLSFFGHKVHAVRTRLQHVDSLLQQSGAAGVIKLRSTLEMPATPQNIAGVCIFSKFRRG